MLKRQIKQEMNACEYVYHVDHEGRLAVGVSRDQGQYHVRFISDISGPLILHWGVAKRSRHEWLMPPSSMFGAQTTVFKNKAAQTPFLDDGHWRQLHLEMSEQEAPAGILFVLKQPDTGRWFRDQGGNFYIPLAVPANLEGFFDDPALAAVADEIIEKEMSGNSWTLMHRFNLCHDLLDRVDNDAEGLALIFVWMRFSAIRQLDWQRDYNTTPRELSHAMDRLTLKLADCYTTWRAGRQFIRLVLTTLGRGGEGQKVRDEVLNIMHRHHIKEVAGHFMEEWHQKLHNNTTPDDVLICRSYLKFLKGNGDLDLFYETLEADGVTKQRLESYERPITSAPDFIPHLKEALIQDFENFLKILRGVHSGTDLGCAIDAARDTLEGHVAGVIDFIWSNRDGRNVSVCTLVDKVTAARRGLAKQLKGNLRLRDLLFLDLSLEDFLRVAVERSFDKKLTTDELVELIAMVLENLTFVRDDDEFTYCWSHWVRLMQMDRYGKEWSLHAKAVLDRTGRALGALVDNYCRVLQPKAEFLGRAFRADSWAINLFSEEVVRGRPAFLLSMLLPRLEPVLRKSAELGNWQVISSAPAAGQVEVIETLKSVQARTFAAPVVIVAEKISGDEEIPQGVSGIITPDVTDILSHVAVRARNCRMLFATCYDPEILGQLRSLSGNRVSLSVNSAGDVVFQQVPSQVTVETPPAPPVCAPIRRPGFTAYALAADDFNEENVGGKSNNLTRLKGKLPEWIGVPASAALPFGVFEKVLSEDANRLSSERCGELIRQLNAEGQEANEKVLNDIRDTVLALHPPKGLVSSLHEAMDRAGLSWPPDFNDAWTCIKRVWGSKWNQRAYLSRRARGISDEDLFVAVLIQEVIEADYSFVIHSVNPFSGSADEIYAEVVLGLGETLVGNYPGRALGFTCKKQDLEPKALSFPGKSVGLFGAGLIFRSDSNGEDLAGYAGAGLYDSVMLRPAREVRLDYAEEPLVWSEDFRKDLLVTIARIGTTVEEIMGSAQDIEGACSKGRYFVVQTRPQVGL